MASPSITTNILLSTGLRVVAPGEQKIEMTIVSCARNMAWNIAKQMAGSDQFIGVHEE